MYFAFSYSLINLVIKLLICVCVCVCVCSDSHTQFHVAVHGSSQREVTPENTDQTQFFCTCPPPGIVLQFELFTHRRRDECYV